MSLTKLGPGHAVPEHVNVIIEIPCRGEPVKYEVDKDTGLMKVDRFLSTSMVYPANYGYIPQTLAEDGDPVDVLVITPVPLVSGTVISARPVGMLKMIDDSGPDVKIIAVPGSKLTKIYDHIKNLSDLSAYTLDSMKHFFEHYKDLEEDRWVKVEAWEEVEAAKQEILAGIEKCDKSSQA